MFFINFCLFDLNINFLPLCRLIFLLLSLSKVWIDYSILGQAAGLNTGWLHVIDLNWLL